MTGEAGDSPNWTVTEADPVSTGNSVLDDSLEGGLPANRATLVIGGPGTGKSTLAMQFLQAGLNQGEDCLLISTEQTPDELAHSFANFDFDLDHDRLTITSIHAVSDRTLDSDDELTLKTLTGGELLDTGIGIPFESQYLRKALSQYGPIDRVVLDSASGLAALDTDDQRFRRAVLDLIRQFTDEFDATSIIISEGRPGDPTTNETGAATGHELLRFATHGVIRLWLENVSGDIHRFLRIEKMRGVDHDTRRFKIQIDPSTGVNIVPRLRSLPDEATDHVYFETGIDGLDDFLGGGLTRGEINLFKHDGRVTLNPFPVAIINQAIDTELPVVLLPPVDVRYQQLNTYLWGNHPSVDALFESDRLFVIDPIRPPADAHQNVFHISSRETYQSALETIHQRTGDQPRVGIFDIDTLLHKLDSESVQQITRETVATLLQSEDTVVFTLNSNSSEEDLHVFLEDICQPVVRLWQDPDGLEILKLEKATTTAPGQTHMIEYTKTPPYLRLV